MLGVATAGVLAGELAAPALSPGVLFVFALSMAALWLAGGRRRAPVAWGAGTLVALAPRAPRRPGDGVRLERGDDRAFPIVRRRPPRPARALACAARDGDRRRGCRSRGARAAGAHRGRGGRDRRRAARRVQPRRRGTHPLDLRPARGPGGGSGLRGVPLASVPQRVARPGHRRRARGRRRESRPGRAVHGAGGPPGRGASLRPHWPWPPSCLPFWPPG